VKTTLQLPDALLHDVKRYAADQGIPMRTVFERGVRQLIEGKVSGEFRSRVVPFKGEGMITVVLMASQVQGPKVHDARIAAICRAAGVREIWTADRDYSRFPGLILRNPLD